MTELFASATVGLAELDYRSILDAIGEGFVLLDHGFTILDINAEGLRLNRRSREDLLGRTHWEV
jgi:PAS domain-containing protein